MFSVVGVVRENVLVVDFVLGGHSFSTFAIPYVKNPRGSGHFFFAGLVDVVSHW